MVTYKILIVIIVAKIRNQMHQTRLEIKKTKQNTILHFRCNPFKCVELCLKNGNCCISCSLFQALSFYTVSSDCCRMNLMIPITSRIVKTIANFHQQGRTTLRADSQITYHRRFLAAWSHSLFFSIISTALLLRLECGCCSFGLFESTNSVVCYSKQRNRFTILLPATNSCDYLCHTIRDVMVDSGFLWWNTDKCHPPCNIYVLTQRLMFLFVSQRLPEVR